MPVRVQDEQGNIHVFPDEATPEMIAKAMNVKPPQAAQQPSEDYGSTGFEAYGEALQKPEARKEQSETLKTIAPSAVGSAVGALGGPWLGGAAYAATKGLVAPERVAAHPIATAVESASFPATDYAMGAISKYAGPLASRLYQSALKPSTRILPSRVASMVETGLENKIPVSEKGVEKLGSLIDDVNENIKQTIASSPGKTVNKFAVASRLSDTAKKFSTQVNPEADLAAISQSGEEFLRSQPGQIPAAQAQALKQGTYQQLGGKAYGELKTATIESQKALARGLKEELASQFPELKQLNARDSKLYDLEGVLSKAVQRISNHQLIGLGTPTAGGAGALISGSAKGGYVSALIKAVVDDPIVKSRLAIALSRAGSMSYPLAANQIAAYSSALSNALTSPPQGGQTSESGK